MLWKRTQKFLRVSPDCKQCQELWFFEKVSHNVCCGFASVKSNQRFGYLRTYYSVLFSYLFISVTLMTNKILLSICSFVVKLRIESSSRFYFFIETKASIRYPTIIHSSSNRCGKKMENFLLYYRLVEWASASFNFLLK